MVGATSLATEVAAQWPPPPAYTGGGGGGRRPAEGFAGATSVASASGEGCGLMRQAVQGVAQHHTNAHRCVSAERSNRVGQTIAPVGRYVAPRQFAAGCLGNAWLGEIN